MEQLVLIQAIWKTVSSLLNMINEMYRKEIELSRIAKTSALLIMSGVSPNSVPLKIIDLCLTKQKDDGGWVGVPDTIWCVKLLQFYRQKYRAQIGKAYEWLQQQKVDNNGWGRSNRDMGRIPVTGILHYLLPEMVTLEESQWLEQLWVKENNSITYKAAYTLMAFRQTKYQCHMESLIMNTVNWLEKQQNDDGGFGPWKGHPVGSNILCTALTLIGLLQYPDLNNPIVSEKALSYILESQLPNGLWRYHQIEDGASWGLYALTRFQNNNGN